MPLSEKELSGFIQSHKLDARIVYLSQSVKKVEDAEKAIGKDRTNIIKAMVLMANEFNPILCIIRGDCQLNLQKVSGVLCASNLRFASRKETLQSVGYDIGSIPPIGHKETLKTLVDRRVLEKQIVYGGGGSERCLLEIEVAKIVELQSATVSDIT